MKYLSGRSRDRHKYWNITLALAAFGLFVYFWPAFRAAFYPEIEPIIRGYGTSKVVAALVPSSVASYFSSHKTLADKNKALELDIERLENLVAEKDAQVREISAVSSAHVSPTQFPIIVLYPIAEDITKIYSTILLSKGYKDGVEERSLVYVRGLQPVCEIVEVYDRTSLCELLSKGNRVTEAVTSSSGIMLSLSGTGGGSFMAEAPKGAEISIGEDVYLRSDQSHKLGTVIAIKDDEQSTGAKIYVRGAYNPVHSSVFYLKARYAP